MRFAAARPGDGRAGSTTIWLVWAPGYQGYGTRCETIATQLLDPGYGGHQWVIQQPGKYYQPMDLTQFEPRGPASAARS